MATIRAIEGANGTRYRAQVRIRRGGEIIYAKAKTFSSKKAAEAWAKNLERDIESDGIPTEHSDMSVAEACGKYLADLEGSPKGVGRSKAQCLRAMSEHETLKGISLRKAKAVDFIEYFKARLAGKYTIDGRHIPCSPARVRDDLAYLRTLYKHAWVDWGLDVSTVEIERAGMSAWTKGYVSKPQSRKYRPSIEDLDKIMSFWVRDRTGRGAASICQTPMTYIVPFLIFSARRLSEVTRLRWDDLDRPRNRILVRDMKHPREKVGNDVWVVLHPRAMAIIDKMPKTSELIFPYDPRTIGNQFTKAHKWAGVDMHLHDLRHEGISHYFELCEQIERVAMVSGHRSWHMLQHYTHLYEYGTKDKYKDWKWLAIHQIDHLPPLIA